MKKYISDFPALLKEWHPTRNKGLNPDQITYGSKKKAWWTCPKGHVYEQAIYSRTSGRGCPVCAGKVSSKENNFKSSFPKIAKEWHPSLNENKRPEDYTKGSKKKVWWLCPNGHEYESLILSRAHGRGCPYCAGKKSSKENNLLSLFPEISSEWHPTKNGNKKPEDYTKGSHQKVWWLCPKGHSYDAIIKNRTKSINPSGCPQCSNQTSKPEIRILTELMKIYDVVKPRYKYKGTEIDIYLPTVKVGIEYDGSYYHKDKYDKDAAKNQFLAKHGIQLIRVREKPLQKIESLDIIVSKEALTKTDLDRIVINVDTAAKGKCHELTLTYIRKKNFLNNKIFREYLYYFPAPIPENSLPSTHPNLADEWDYVKNSPLLPRSFSAGSSSKVSWVCIKGHSYEASIKSRAGKGSGCPYCAGKKVCNDNSLALNNPKLAKEWHPTENGSITPGMVTKASNKKVIWLCPKGHSYQSTISSRAAGNGCPMCAGKIASKENNLQSKHPELANEWHPSLNKKLTPSQVTPSSTKKAWWLCPQKHEYDMMVSDRTRGKNCPFCSGRRACNDNSLQTIFPNIAKEWHPSENLPLTPNDVTKGSKQRVYWLCPKGHSYDAVICERTRKSKPTGCPFCAGKKVSKENSLQYCFPDLAKQWHPIKNGDLSPEDITKSSSKSVWWLCPNGHSFEKSVKHRTKLKNPLKCPKCKR